MNITVAAIVILTPDHKATMRKNVTIKAGNRRLCSLGVKIALVVVVVVVGTKGPFSKNKHKTKTKSTKAK